MESEQMPPNDEYCIMGVGTVYRSSTEDSRVLGGGIPWDERSNNRAGIDGDHKSFKNCKLKTSFT